MNTLTYQSSGQWGQASGTTSIVFPMKFSTKFLTACVTHFGTAKSNTIIIYWPIGTSDGKPTVNGMEILTYIDSAKYAFYHVIGY